MAAYSLAPVFQLFFFVLGKILGMGFYSVSWDVQLSQGCQYEWPDKSSQLLPTKNFLFNFHCAIFCEWKRALVLKFITVSVASPWTKLQLHIFREGRVHGSPRTLSYRRCPLQFKKSNLIISQNFINAELDLVKILLTEIYTFKFCPTKLWFCARLSSIHLQIDILMKTFRANCFFKEEDLARKYECLETPLIWDLLCELYMLYDNKARK